MSAEPRILAFDTSGPYISSCYYCDFARSQSHEDMARGQAEALMPMLERELSKNGVGWGDLDLIAVGIGPGNFTGIRISVAAARGIALGLGIPLLGVSSFHAMRDPLDGIAAHSAEIISLEAPRGKAYVQAFRYGRPQAEPRLIDPLAPPQDIELPVNMRVVGYRAGDIARAFGAEAKEAALSDVAQRMAAVAEWRVYHEREAPAPPAPLYVRPADAAPASDPPPVILS